MKYCIIILLLAGLLGQTFSKFIILAGYEVNKDYIAHNLCINKALPLMHCNGKCQLMKKLKAEDQNNKPVSENNTGKSQSNEVLFFNSLTCIQFKAQYLQKSTFGSRYLLIHYLSPLSSIFHPPTV